MKAIVGIVGDVGRVGDSARWLGRGVGALDGAGVRWKGVQNVFLGGPIFFEGASSVSCPSGMYKRTHLKYIFNRNHSGCWKCSSVGYIENMATTCTNVYKHKFSCTKFGSVCTKVQMWN